LIKVWRKVIVMMNMITKNKQSAANVPLITKMAKSVCLISDPSSFGSV